MGIGKDRLSYDATDANTLAASDTIGAYNLDAAGARITSTLISGKQAMDVNIANTLAVSVDLNGVYSGANLVPDSVGNIFYARAATPALADQTFTATGGKANADAIVAAQVWGQDSISYGMLYNGTSWDRATGTAGSANVNVTGGSVTVSDTALANTAIKSSAVNATSTAVTLGTPLALRKYLAVQNLGGAAIYFGDSSVTAATGLRLSNGAMLEGLRIGPAISPKVLTSAGAADVRVMELS